ncbi:Pentatricopeptide repeat-containing protein [Rhynchospora pubera]|uniref:Pentatricopeptide repeat-containing protein n=1 Tax=Rhynchospora pubera TaxID=906938 RepID=A0AAV8C2R8_9POAL|nr:Pentatricopeptide repeat-containing protein [Rhynchospora pubera]
MSLSKPLFFHFHLRPTPFRLATFRRLSFATPEDAAAERRRRKRRLRIEPPLSNSRPAQQTLPRIPRPLSNPNAPKLPEPMSALSGKRLELHNRMLGLIRENYLEEASLLTRHSIYSNCRPTAFTCNAVLNALLRQARYSDLLILHRFVTQASVPPSLSTHNIILQAYCDCRKPETALEHFRILLKDDSPVSPSPTSYRILAKGLVDASKLDLAVELKDGMLEKGFVKPDPQVGRVDDAKGLFDEMPQREAKPDITSYEILLKAYIDKHRLDDAIKSAKRCLLDEGVIFTEEMKELLEAVLKKEGREDEIARLYEEVERERVEAAARAAEEKAKVEMAAREEEERKKAEAAAKEEAAARASRAAIEAILGRSKEGERGESSTRDDDVGGNTNGPNGGGGISAEQGKVPEMP